MEFRIARAGSLTGRLLMELVGDVDVDAVVCYGMGYSGSLPSLNRNAGRLNKLEQARRLHEVLPGNLSIRPMEYAEALERVTRGKMVLGRSLSHTQGKDIIPLVEPWQVEASIGSCDFYTQYVYSSGEYRTWVYRNRHLGTYRKVITRPSAFKRFGRNFANGFTFERVENDQVPESIKNLARSAVRALDLDFGAVDLLVEGTDAMVLEVNAAPGVQDERRRVIQGLAHRIRRWAENGCPGRNHAE
jgi:hypothetical protein